MASLQFDNGNALQARAFLQRYQDVAPPTAGSLWLGYRIEVNLGDSAAAGEYARKLRKEFPTSVEADELFQAERARP
jgi:type IV pilus assembly protein PilF